MIPLNIFAIIGLSVAGVAGATVVFVGGRWAVRKIIGAVRNFQIRRNEVNLQKELAKKAVNPENIQNIVKHLAKLHKSKFARVSPKFFSKNLLGADPRKINPKTRQFIQDYYKEIEKVVKGEKKDIDSKFKTTGKFSRKISLESATGNTISLDDQSTFIVNESQYAQKFFAKELEETTNQPRKGGHIVDRGQEIYPIVTEVVDNDIVERNKGRISKLNETILQFSDTSPQRAIKNAQVLFASLFAKAEELEEQGKEPNFTISYYDAATKKGLLKRGEIIIKKTFNSSEEIFQFYCDDYMEFLNKKEIGNKEALGPTGGLTREAQLLEFKNLRNDRNIAKGNFDIAKTALVNENNDYEEAKKARDKANTILTEITAKYETARDAAIAAGVLTPGGIPVTDNPTFNLTLEGGRLNIQITNAQTDLSDAEAELTLRTADLISAEDTYRIEKNNFKIAQAALESSPNFDFIKNFNKHFKEIKKEVTKKKARHSTI